MTSAPTPDTSPGDELLQDIIHIGYVYGYNQLAQMAQVAPYNHRQPLTEAEAKDRLNRLMLTREREGREKLNRLLNNITPEMINGHTYWRCSIVYKAIAAIDAQLNKEEK